MKVKKIYQPNEGKEVIFQLENGIKIIRRSDDTVKKLNINKWEEVNFIPESFQEINREVSKREKRQLKKFLNKNVYEESFFGKFKAYIKNIFNS